jgi:UDP-glucose 4-epimerase
VINLDRRQASVPAARFVYADLRQREQVQPMLERVDAVCHLGEIPSVHAGISPEQVLYRNVQAGSVVLQTAADLRVKRVIYTSSAQVYGMWDGTSTKPQRLPFDETHPLYPHNAYALGKATNELYCRLMAEMHGLSVAAFRLPWVAAEDYSEKQVQALKESPTATDGFATYCHVTDVARAFALAVEKPRPGFEAYHFSAAEIFSFHPLRERLAMHHPTFPPLPADWPDFKSPLVTAKAREHFGWEPQWNFLEMYRQRHGPIAALALA